MQLKKTNNLSVSRPPRDLSACAEHAPVPAQQRRSLQAGRCVSHRQDQKDAIRFYNTAPSLAEVQQWPAQPPC